MKISDLELIITEVVPPVGGVLSFSAKVQFLYIEDKNDRRKVTYDFGETLGKTSKEAETKMQEKVNNWLITQLG